MSDESTPEDKLDTRLEEQFDIWVDRKFFEGTWKQRPMLQALLSSAAQKQFKEGRKSGMSIVAGLYSKLWPKDDGNPAQAGKRLVETIHKRYKEHADDVVVIQWNELWPRIKYKKVAAGTVLATLPESPAPGAPQKNQESSADLDPYRQEWHHYHLTLSKKRAPVWIYKIVDFRNSPPDEKRLVKRVAVLPDRNAKPKDNWYQFEASLQGPHLMMRAGRVHDKSDFAVEIYPHVGPVQFASADGALYSARINQTWHQTTVASSVGIMSVERRGDQTEEGPVTSQSLSDALLREWNQHAETHPEIIRLPLVQPPLKGARSSEAIRIIPKWQQGRFNDLLDTVERGPDGKKWEERGDLRIVTTFFINETDMREKIIECLERGVRIKVLVTNPTNKALMDARFGARVDRFKTRRALQQARQHIEFLKALPDEIRENNRECKGTIDVRVSDLMPSGFVVHCKEWAVWGLMPARESYEAAPMIEIDPGTKPWEKIDLDWSARWRKSKPARKGIHYGTRPRSRSS